MTCCPPSTIAQLLFESAPGKTFPALVRELDDALAQRGGERQLRWDNDDIVFVDFNGTRVGLGYFEDPAPGLAACLVVTAGPAPGTTAFSAAKAYDSLCRRIVTCANNSLCADTVLWHQTAEPVTCDLIDGLIEMLEPATSEIAPLPVPTVAVVPMSEPEKVNASLFGANSHISRAIRSRRGMRSLRRSLGRTTAAIRNPAPAMPRLHDPERARIQQALHPDPEDGVVTNAQRMSAHAMNATLVILMPPVGAGLVAASYRYGVNLKHSARAMCATGALFGLAHSAAAAEFIFSLPL